MLSVTSLNLVFGNGRIAEELLAHGCNVILHGRNHDKLLGVQKHFAAIYPDVRTALFVYDASNLDVTVPNSSNNYSAGTSLGAGASSLYTALSSVLEGRRLTILVNNVGYTSSFDHVWHQSPLEMDAIIDVGIRFMTHITRACLPFLLAPDHTPALIVNVTGLTAEYPSPFLAIHSGAKAYIKAFSRALSIELDLMEPRGSPRHVECIAVDVHNVASNSNSSKPSFFTYVFLFPILVPCYPPGKSADSTPILYDTILCLSLFVGSTYAPSTRAHAPRNMWNDTFILISPCHHHTIRLNHPSAIDTKIAHPELSKPKLSSE